jgi:DNA-binding transcriptional regulator YhcF (GntR family)
MKVSFKLYRPFYNLFAKAKQLNCVLRYSGCLCLNSVAVVLEHMLFVTAGTPHSMAVRKKATHSRENQRERVYRHIRRALMTGVYEPGQRITVASLSSALGVSAMPVREALRRLAAERALEMQPNRSVTVPRLSRVEILKVREVRERMCWQDRLLRKCRGCA